jgi:hypothetical protein
MAAAVSLVQHTHHYTYGFLADCDDLPQVLLCHGEFLLGTLSFLAQSRERRLDLIRRGVGVIEHGAQLFLGFFYGCQFPCRSTLAAARSVAAGSIAAGATLAAASSTHHATASAHHSTASAASALPAEFLDLRDARSKHFPFRLGGAELLPHALIHHLAHLLRVELSPTAATALLAAPLSALALLTAPLSALSLLTASLFLLRQRLARQQESNEGSRCDSQNCLFSQHLLSPFNEKM